MSAMTAASTPRSASGGVCTGVVGLQWGDEGKGKIVDLLTAQHDVVVRYNGGANAGHSVVIAGQRYALHLIPAGILSPGKLAVIGNGVVVDPEALLKELDTLIGKGVDVSGLVVSQNAHVVLPYHKEEDTLREELLKGEGAGAGLASASEPSIVTEIGTTRRGIGPCYADKVQRAAGVRMADLLRPEILTAKIKIAATLKNPVFASRGKPAINVGEVVERALAFGKRLAPMIRDTTYLLHEQLAAGKRVMFEGANGTLLDVDHGTYPYVTGSSTAAGGIGPGSGVPTQRLSSLLGVMKAYSTRVGSGPMPTELFDAVGDGIRQRGREFGTTTGRPRRVGWLDLVALKYTAMVNGATGLSVMLLDVLSGVDKLQVCTGYSIDGKTTDRFPADSFDLAKAKPVYTTLPGFVEPVTGARKISDLPASARNYLDTIERTVGVPLAFVSVGPDREQTIVAG